MIKKCLCMIVLLLASVFSITVQAAVENGWEEIDGKSYWYENGVLQGYDAANPNYRGKEIYDASSDAWYWLDNVQGGAKAVNKDVYQESAAGQWADRADGTGKWVRYDENGHMIKGWNRNETGTYYFDPVYGTMAKGLVSIDGLSFYFDVHNGIQQGYDPDNEAYRGKEIYDPSSDAWYWFDNAQGGAKAVNKDVYQESAAGQWADRADGTGKWVRYDENGHMIKGWDTNATGTYYFDPVYGTMAKGTVEIDGETYRFNETTGVLESMGGELAWYVAKDVQYNGNDRVVNFSEYKYNHKGECIKLTRYEGSSKRIVYNEETEYDAAGNIVTQMIQNYSTDSDYYMSEEILCVYENGILLTQSKTVYDSEGQISYVEDTEYIPNGNVQNIYRYDAEGTLTREYTYTYDENGYLISRKHENYENVMGNSILYYENDSEGKLLKMTEYNYQNELIYTTVYTYDNNTGERLSYEIRDEINGYSTERREFDYDLLGNCLESRYFYRMAILVDEPNYIYEYEMKLRSKNVYAYDGDGNRIQADVYSYDIHGNERHTSCVTYSYEACGEQGALVKTYDSYYEHSKMDENGYFVYDENGKIIYELGYNYGYENDRDDEGVLSKQTFYIGNSSNRYTKTLNYWVEYEQISLAEPEQFGQTCEKRPYSVAYNADGSVKYYTVQEYVACYVNHNN